MQIDDLAVVKDDMIAFIAGLGMRRMTAFIPEDVPTVIFESENSDGWKDFLEHAQATQAPFVSMSEVMLEPEDVATLIGTVRDQNYPDHNALEMEEAQGLTAHVGKTGYLQLGFSHGGVVYLYETATEWYDTFQELMDTMHDLGHIIVEDPDED